MQVKAEAVDDPAQAGQRCGGVLHLILRRCLNSPILVQLAQQRFRADRLRCFYLQVIDIHLFRFLAGSGVGAELTLQAVHQVPRAFCPGQYTMFETAFLSFTAPGPAIASPAMRDAPENFPLVHISVGIGDHRAAVHVIIAKLAFIDPPVGKF